MKTVLGLALGFVALVLVGAGIQAQEKKEVTLKGTLLCAKCELKEEPKCMNAIKVKEDGKDVVYRLKDKGGKAEYHGKICQETKEGEVKGVVSEENGKKYITPSEGGVKFKD